ncbi:uncharacterized protein RHO17_025315 [Thomomys bottae]
MAQQKGKRVGSGRKPCLKSANNTNPTQCGGHRIPQPSNFQVKHHRREPEQLRACDCEGSAGLPPPAPRGRPLALPPYLHAPRTPARCSRLPASGPGSSPLAQSPAASDSYWPRCPTTAENYQMVRGRTWRQPPSSAEPAAVPSGAPRPPGPLSSARPPLPILSGRSGKGTGRERGEAGDGGALRGRS